MSPHMGVNPEQIKTPKPVPGNQFYELRLKEITCKLTKAKNGHNYTFVNEVINNKAELNGTKVYIRATTVGEFAGNRFVEIVHGYGFDLEKNGSIPGNWEFDPKDPDNVEKARYKGVLLGKDMRAELVIDTYEGNEKNEVKQITCKLANCKTLHPDFKHRTDLIGKKN